MSFINTWKISEIQAYIDSNIEDYKGLEVIDFSVAGIGNMNYTYRVKFKNNETIIIKQAPPFAAKFPSISAMNNIEISDNNYIYNINKLEGFLYDKPNKYSKRRKRYFRDF